jgi:hypothetical protein
MRWIWLVCLATEGPYLCEPAKEPEGRVIHPHPITYADGQPAYQVGPFFNRPEMQAFIGDVCHRGRDGGTGGMGYDLLDEYDDAIEHTSGKGTAASSRYLTVSKDQSRTSVEHSITATFRCKAVTTGADARGDDAGALE